MTTVSDASVLEVRYREDGSRWWWVFLVTGTLWVLLSLVILTIDPTSVTVIAYMTGAVIILAAAAELAMAFVAEGWRWVHALLGLLFIAGGVAAFVHPLQTFSILAVLIGWWLVVKGTVDIVESIAGREYLDLWGLVLAVGIAQLLIGIWAIGSPVRSAWLLVLWVGLGALSRGITEIFLAFRIRSLGSAA